MNKLFWLINAGLLVAAVWVTLLAAQAPSPRTRATDLTPKREAKRGETRPARPSTTAASLVPASVDVLWEKSLFRPDRTEEEATETPGPAGAGGKAGAEGMELIGIGRVGDIAAAIILTRAAPAAPPPGPRPGLGPGAAKAGAAAKAERPAKTQHIYKVGQAVGDSGYKVKEIRLTEVVLVHGSEELTLKLEKGDASSKTRSDSAAAIAASRSAAAAAVLPPPIPMPGAALAGAAGAAHGTPPPPPPPPPIPGMLPTTAHGGGGAAVANAATTAVSGASKEERIKAALEARRRILDKRQQPP